jgi:AcrR family transcriptional regulator
MTQPGRRKGRPRKDDDRAAARERLLDAAHELMCERSTIDVPVNEIAIRTGLNVALINYYFGSKDGLLVDLAMRHRAGYANALESLLKAEFTAAQKLTLHIRGIVRAFRRVPYLQRLLHKILRDSSEEEARACGAAMVRPLGAFYKQIVAQSKADGTLRAVDHMHLYITIVGACDFLYSGSASLSYGFGLDHVDDDLSENYANHLVSIVMAGLHPNAHHVTPAPGIIANTRIRHRE